MACIRKRDTKWHVQIRRAGQPSITRTFIKKSLASEWARRTETDLDNNGFIAERTQLLKITLADLLRRYLDEVIIHKKGAGVESYVIGSLLRHKISRYTLKSLTPDMFRQYRDERLKTVKPSTISRQLSIIRHAFSVAKNEWGIPITDNPVARIKMPSPNTQRNRRLKHNELELLLNGCKESRVWWLSPLIQLAIETGMRRGELLNIKEENINIDTRTLHIPVTKNGHPRTIPLSTKAVQILSSLQKHEKEDRIFPITGNAVRLAWGRLKRRVGVTDLRFHDLRHEATSRFFEKDLNVMEVATITGHKDIRMLQRYTHLRAEDLAKKLK